MPGRRELTLTGRLGDVMQESARTALSFVRANAERLGIDGELFEHSEVHVHVPAGAVSKDGPSAGITLAVALVSLLTGRPVRRRVALTGELTLSGRILPVGGVKEKILAARRAGVATALLPRRNQAQVEAMDKGIIGDLEIQYMETADDALATALLPVERVRGSFTRFSCDSRPGVRPSV
jgi:ATP-dependent Lon protease